VPEAGAPASGMRAQGSGAERRSRR
jgi:hypothetical protein